jgi:glutaredoxin
MQFIDQIRVKVRDALASETYDRFRAVRVVREVLGTANDLVGRPFCTQAELDERRGGGSAEAAAAPVREAAPVMLYVDGKDQRSKKKIEELLQARDIRFTVLDVSEDEATRTWALAAAKQAEFPLVFIAGDPIGGLHELTQADVNGLLKKKVFAA